MMPNLIPWFLNPFLENKPKKHITCNIHDKIQLFWAGVGARVVYILQYIRLQIIWAAVIDMKTRWRIGGEPIKTTNEGA